MVLPAKVKTLGWPLIYSSFKSSNRSSSLFPLTSGMEGSLIPSTIVSRSDESNFLRLEELVLVFDLADLEVKVEIPKDSLGACRNVASLRR